jgi:small-conductance mechanosensitive channel
VTKNLPSFDAPELLQRPLISLGVVQLTVLSLALGLLVLVLSFVAARLGRSAVLRASALQKVPEGSRYAFARIVQQAIFFIGVLAAVQTAGVSLTGLVAASAAVFVGVGLGLQRITSDFVSGVVLLVEQPVRKGDCVRVGDTFGRVEDIKGRRTFVLTRAGAMLLVPNSEFVNGHVLNASLPDPKTRVAVRVGVSYRSSPERVREVLLEAAAGVPAVRAEPAPRALFVDYGESALVFELQAWIDDPWDEPVVASDLRFAVSAAFARHGIEVPFPQRVVRFENAPPPAPPPPSLDRHPFVLVVLVVLAALAVVLALAALVAVAAPVATPSAAVVTPSAAVAAPTPAVVARARPVVARPVVARLVAAAPVPEAAVVFVFVFVVFVFVFATAVGRPGAAGVATQVGVVRLFARFGLAALGRAVAQVVTAGRLVSTTGRARERPDEGETRRQAGAGPSHHGGPEVATSVPAWRPGAPGRGAART